MKKQKISNTNQAKMPIVILHGWRKRGKDYDVLKKILEQDGFSVDAPDMPGFGSEPLGKKVMRIDDYVAFIYDFLQKKKYKKVILIGHSFGGRVAAKFAYRYPEIVQKLIITGSPLIKRKLTTKKQIISSLAKTGKKILAVLPENYSDMFRKILYRSLGEWDYYKSGNLRETFLHVINEDISPVLSKISIPALLVWGENETFVPVVDGKEISQR